MKIIHVCLVILAVSAAATALSADAEIEKTAEIFKNIAANAETKTGTLEQIQSVLQKLDEKKGPIKDKKAHHAMRYHMLRAAAHIMDQMAARARKTAKTWYNVASDVDIAGNRGLYYEFPVSGSAQGFHMTFEAEGTSDLMVSFMSEKAQKTANAYEVILGGFQNTQSSIRVGTTANGDFKVLSKDNVVGRAPASGQKKQFWIAFNGKVLQVGDANGMILAADMPALKSKKTISGTPERLIVGFTCWEVSVSYTQIKMRDVTTGLWEDFGESTIVPPPALPFPRSVVKLPLDGPLVDGKVVTKLRTIKDFCVKAGSVRVFYQHVQNDNFGMTFKASSAAGIHFGIHKGVAKGNKVITLDELHDQGSYTGKLAMTDPTGPMKVSSLTADGRTSEAKHFDATHVDPEVMTEYWAYLYKGHVYVGTGDFNTQAFLSQRVKRLDAKKLDLSFHGGKSELCVKDMITFKIKEPFAFPAMKVEPTKGHYRMFGWPVNPKRFGMTFEAMGASDIHVAYMCKKAERTPNAYEVLIGGLSNQHSEIRHGTSGRELSHVVKAGLATATHYSKYWTYLNTGAKKASFDKYSVENLDKSAPEGKFYTLVVGRGEFGKNPFMLATVPALNCEGSDSADGNLITGFGSWDAEVAIRNVKVLSSDQIAAHKPQTKLPDADADAYAGQCPETIRHDHKACMQWNLYRASANALRQMAERHRKNANEFRTDSKIKNYHPDKINYKNKSHLNY